MATAYPDSNLGNDEFDQMLELEFYLTVKTHHYDRSVLFIGITGQGKSSLCNFLMKEEKFQIDDSMASCPEPSKQALTKLKGKNYLLVDVPGVCDTVRDPKVVLSELTKAIFFVRKQGISAIAIVIDPNQKMMTELYDALVDFLERISPNIWKYVIVVFTHEKQTMRKHSTSGDEYITKMLQSNYCPKFLKFVSEKCDNRSLHVECETLSEDEQYWEMKNSFFTEYVESIMAKHGHLKTDMMNKMDQNYQNLIPFKKRRGGFIKELESFRKNLRQLKEVEIALNEVEIARIEVEIARIEVEIARNEVKIAQLEELISENEDLMLNQIKDMKKGFLASLGLAAAAPLLGLCLLASAATAATVAIAAAPALAASLLVFGISIIFRTK